VEKAELTKKEFIDSESEKGAVEKQKRCWVAKKIELVNQTKTPCHRKHELHQRWFIKESASEVTRKEEKRVKFEMDRLYPPLATKRHEAFTLFDSILKSD
jgi:hypothetical protein